jgi:hypothetical protein
MHVPADFLGCGCANGKPVDKVCRSLLSAIELSGNPFGAVRGLAEISGGSEPYIGVAVNQPRFENVLALTSVARRMRDVAAAADRI